MVNSCWWAMGLQQAWTCHSHQCWGWAARKWHNLQECECWLWLLGLVLWNLDSEKSLCVYTDTCKYPLSVLCSMKWWLLICPCRERCPHCSAIKEPLGLGLSLTREQLPKPKRNHHASVLCPTSSLVSAGLEADLGWEQDAWGRLLVQQGPRVDLSR